MVQLVLVLRWRSACLCLLQLSKVGVNWLAGKTTLSSDLRKASCLSGQQTVRKAFGPQITAQGWPGLSEVEKKKPKPQLSGLLDVTGGFSFTVGLAFPRGGLEAPFRSWDRCPWGQRPAARGRGHSPALQTKSSTGCTLARRLWALLFPGKEGL